MSHRDLGTGSGHAAAGNHTHAYASTNHVSEHQTGGSQPLTDLPSVTVNNRSNSGSYLEWNGQDSPVAAPPDDSSGRLYIERRGYAPAPAFRSQGRGAPFGTGVRTPQALWIARPNTGSTAPLNETGISSANAGTWSAPTPATSVGYTQRCTSGTTTSTPAQISTTDTRWVRGDNTFPWCGYYFEAWLAFNAGAYSSSFIFVGMTSNTALAMTQAADPTGHRHGFRVSNGTGNWLLTTKAGGTEATTDTGVAFATGKVYQFIVNMNANASYPMYELRNITDSTGSGSNLDFSATAPGATTFMRAMAGVGTANTTAKSFDLIHIGCEVSLG